MRNKTCYSIAVALALLQPPLAAQPPADSALVLYLPFRAGARDESPWHHRVVEHHAAYGPDRLGQTGGAFYANGADAYLEIPPAPALDLPGSLTLSLWAKAEESSPANAELTLMWRGPDITWQAFRLVADGVGVYFWANDQFGSSFVLSQHFISSSERWAHYVVCLDAAKGEGRLYINGRLRLTLKTTIHRLDFREVPTMIGGRFYGETAMEMWKGWIDDVRLYNRALAPAEVAALTEGYAFPSDASAYTPTDRLEPGRYVLAPVVSADSLSLGPPRLLVVPALEPVWKKGWFLGMIAVSIVAFSLLGSWFFYRQQQLEQTLEFEKIRTLEAERFRIAREMHEDIGSGLSALQLLTDMALHKNLDPGLATEIEYIAASSQKVSERIREIIWTIDMRHDTLEHLVVYFQQYATDYFHHANLDVNIALPPRMPAALLPGNTRRMIFLAFKEALHNIVKHAHATRVDIAFTLAAKQLTIRIRDNGRGFDPATVGDSGNGLVNMKKRMEDIGGVFRVESEEGGTTVWFEVRW